jgi:hypothetical protein
MGMFREIRVKISDPMYSQKQVERRRSGWIEEFDGVSQMRRHEISCEYGLQTQERSKKQIGAQKEHVSSAEKRLQSR